MGTGGFQSEFPSTACTTGDVFSGVESIGVKIVFPIYIEMVMGFNMQIHKCYQNPLGQLSKQFSKLYQLCGPVT